MYGAIFCASPSGPGIFVMTGVLHTHLRLPYPVQDVFSNHPSIHNHYKWYLLNLINNKEYIVFLPTNAGFVPFLAGPVFYTGLMGLNSEVAAFGNCCKPQLSTISFPSISFNRTSIISCLNDCFFPLGIRSYW